MSRIVSTRDLLGAAEETWYPPPDPGHHRKVHIQVRLPPQCTANSFGDGGDEAEAAVLPAVTASADGSELSITALDNMTVHELQLLILQSATDVPVPFDLRHLPAPEVAEVDVISPNHCTEETFLRVDRQLAPVLQTLCPDVLVRLHEYHRVLLRKPVSFVSDQLNTRCKKIPEQVAMTLHLLNETLNRNGCPNAVVELEYFVQEMEYFVQYPTTTTRKSARSVAQKRIESIRDLLTKAGADGLVHWRANAHNVPINKHFLPVCIHPQICFMYI